MTPRLSSPQSAGREGTSARFRRFRWRAALPSTAYIRPHRHAITQAGLHHLSAGGGRFDRGAACAGIPARRQASHPTRPAPSWSRSAQFALGCLLSGFCVFYIRSASITSSWPFLLCMAAIFIGNEYMRRYHARLVFSALLFFFSLYSYAILLVPVVIARIGRIPFLMSAASWRWCVFFFYMQALARLGHDRYRGRAHADLRSGWLRSPLLINLSYFLRSVSAPAFGPVRRRRLSRCQARRRRFPGQCRG